MSKKPEQKHYTFEIPDKDGIRLIKVVSPYKQKSFVDKLKQCYVLNIRRC